MKRKQNNEEIFENASLICRICKTPGTPVTDKQATPAMQF